MKRVQSALKIVKTVGLGTVLAISTGCATTPHEVETVETEMEVKSKMGDKTIGLNDEGQAILQEETSAADELRIQNAVNENLSAELNGEAFYLNRCREDIADPRLGGNGEVEEIKAIDDMRPVDEVKEEFGLDESDGTLKVVRKEFYVEKLKSARKFEKSLKKLLRVVKKHRKSCERKMGYARQRAGLPAQRFNGSGFFDGEGDWIQTGEAENNLDDAFRIMSMLRAKKKEQFKTH